MANGAVRRSGVQSPLTSAGGTPSPLSTKGDLFVFGSSNDRLPVGANNYELVPDSTKALGLDWRPKHYATAPAPSGGDDFAVLQAFFDLWFPLGVCVRLRAGVYLTSAELQMKATSKAARLYGAGHNYLSTGGTTIQATAAIRSVLAQLTSYALIEDVKLDAASTATYGLYLNTSNLSRYTNVFVTNGKLDGIFLETSAGGKLNDTSVWTQCWSVGNGTVYVNAAIAAQYNARGSAINVRTSAITGTATVAAGNSTITIAAGTDLTTLGVRKGDWIRTGSGALNASMTYAGQIESVTSTTIVLAAANANLPTAAHAGSGLNYAIAVGDGWREAISADNNIHTVIGGLFRSNAGVAISTHALFGSTFIGVQTDGNGFGAIGLGDADNANLVRGTAMVRPYSESDNGHFDVFYGDCSGISIVSPTFGVGTSRGITGSTSGMIFNGESPESISLGLDQNFLFEVENVAGTIKHRIVANHFGGFASLAAGRVTGQTVAVTTTPTVDSTHDFAAGAGLFSAGGTLVVLLNTAGTQNLAPDGMVRIEYDDTGSAHQVALEVQSAVNVNGVTRNWIALYLMNSSGTLIDWSAANIGAGKTIGVRFDVKMK